jgi:hypothetical protein
MNFETGSTQAAAGKQNPPNLNQLNKVRSEHRLRLPSARSMPRLCPKARGGSSMDDNLDMEALDGYLSSDDSPENCMMLSDLDGFIHGVICSPEQIPSEEWMHVALGGGA